MKKIYFIIVAAICCFSVASYAQCSYDEDNVKIKFKKALLDGEFTVNNSGDKVRFSPGNLRYQASTATWDFHENQYDFIGNASGNTTASSRSTQSAWIDLFGWATSGNSASGTTYQPWESSTTAANYGPSISSGEWTAANSDWGAVNFTTGTSWRTLKKDEWVYMLTTRATSVTLSGTSNARYTMASINTDGTSVNGMIIIPDGYAGGTPSGVTWGTMNTFSNWTTECTTAGWISLEEEGCVFLPVAHYRSGTTVTEGITGFYWSSTAAASNKAYRLNFSSAAVNPEKDFDRSCGFSVRLVHDVE